MIEFAWHSGTNRIVAMRDAHGHVCFFGSMNPSTPEKVRDLFCKGYDNNINMKKTSLFLDSKNKMHRFLFFSQIENGCVLVNVFLLFYFYE
jgi:hypothetical protein